MVGDVAAAVCRLIASSYRVWFDQKVGQIGVGTASNYVFVFYEQQVIVRTVGEEVPLEVSRFLISDSPKPTHSKHLEFYFPISSFDGALDGGEKPCGVTSIESPVVPGHR